MKLFSRIRDAVASIFGRQPAKPTRRRLGPDPETVSRFTEPDKPVTGRRARPLGAAA